jgi:hypothetical protein
MKNDRVHQTSCASHRFLKLLPSVFNIKSTDYSFEWILYLGTRIPHDVLIAQVNEKANLVCFIQLKARSSSVIKLFLKDGKVRESFMKVDSNQMEAVKRFLEIVKFDLDLDDS